MSSKLTVGEQLAEILNDVQKDVRNATTKTLRVVAKESVQRLKNTSPKKSGSYARGWATKSESDNSVIVHNKTDYQLTHLLEFGHMTVNRKGTYGRTPAHPHIKPVEEWANEELVTRITEEVNENL